MSLSLSWWEHDDGIRITDSRDDEVEAFFGDEVESLRHHRTFGESFQVHCVILTEFEHTGWEIHSWTGNCYDVPLKEVLDVLAARRRILRNVARKLEQQISDATSGVLHQTRLSPLSAKFTEELMDCGKELSESIIIQYLNFVIGQFDDEDRLETDFYLEQLDAFSDYFFSSTT